MNKVDVIIGLQHGDEAKAKCAYSICKENNVETDIFETTNYTDDLEKGMIRKTKIGNGRAFTLDEMGNPIKPTWDMIPDFVAKVHKFKPDIMIISVVEDVFDITRQLLQSIQPMNIPSSVPLTASTITVESSANTEPTTSPVTLPTTLPKCVPVLLPTTLPVTEPTTSPVKLPTTLVAVTELVTTGPTILPFIASTRSVESSP